MAKKKLPTKKKGPSKIDLQREAEKAYRAARRNLARAQRIAGTFDPKEFAKSRKNLLIESPEKLQKEAMRREKERVRTLKRVVRKHKNETKGTGAQTSATAIFDLVERQRRFELREQLEEDSDKMLLDLQTAALNDTLEKVEVKTVGNEFKPGDSSDWSRIY